MVLKKNGGICLLCTLVRVKVWQVNRGQYFKFQNQIHLIH